MNYIILDLEWNQPISFNSSAYKRVGDRLKFEVIQIGAIKLDEKRRMVGSFNSFVLPTHYVRLHPRISRITGIKQNDLTGEDHFAKAYERFLAWCGEDSILFTWGQDDLSILTQNISFFGCPDLPHKIYDLQPVFTQLVDGGKNRHSLRKAMIYHHINPSSDHPFHSAVDDAYYTALVFQKMPEGTEFFAFPQTAKIPAVQTNNGAQTTFEKRVDNILSALKSRAAMSPLCPVCGKHVKIPEGYAPLREENTFMALADCKKHGLINCELHFVKNEDGYIMTQSVSLSDEQHPAYVRTKHLQWAKKVKRFQGATA
jgi:inhibitor of KinA sporulation pathway (predicted exonuclease)